MSNAQSINLLYKRSINKFIEINNLFYFFFKKNESRFTSLISDIRLEMQLNMTDTQSGPATLVRLFQLAIVIYMYIYI